MVLVTGNWKLWLAGMAVSLIIFLVVLFAVILPAQSTANQAIKSGEHQAQQALKQASQQLNGASNGSSGSSNGSVSATDKKAKHELSQAAKLAACVSAAGTDLTKLQACHTKF